MTIAKMGLLSTAMLLASIVGGVIGGRWAQSNRSTEVGGLHIVNSRGESLLELGLFEDSSPMLALMGPKGHVRSRIGIWNSQMAEFEFGQQEDMDPKWRTGCFRLSQGLEGVKLELLDGALRTRFRVGVDVKGNARLAVLDEGGGVIWHAP